MNCCGNHDHDGQNHENHTQGNENHSAHRTHQRGHNLMMVVCLIIPIAVVIGLFFTGRFSGSSSLLILVAVLVCPLMHLFMMSTMVKKGNERHH